VRIESGELGRQRCKYVPGPLYAHVWPCEVDLGLGVDVAKAVLGDAKAKPVLGDANAKAVSGDAKAKAVLGDAKLVLEVVWDDKLVLEVVRDDKLVLEVVRDAKLVSDSFSSLPCFTGVLYCTTSGVGPWYLNTVLASWILAPGLAIKVLARIFPKGSPRHFA
jgi:hypothetical protein